MKDNYYQYEICIDFATCGDLIVNVTFDNIKSTSWWLPPLI